MEHKYMPGQEPTAEDYLAKIAPLIHDVALIVECVDSDELDQWEREQYARLKLEQECKE